MSKVVLTSAGQVLLALPDMTVTTEAFLKKNDGEKSQTHGKECHGRDENDDGSRGSRGGLLLDVKLRR